MPKSMVLFTYNTKYEVINMEEDLVLIYQFEMTLKEIQEYYEQKYGKGAMFLALDSDMKCEFPINELLKDNDIESFNEFDLKPPRDVIVRTSENNGEPVLLIKVFVYKKDELAALRIIENDVSYESTDELDHFVPFDEEDDIIS